MIKRNISQIVKKQIKQELRQQNSVSVIANNKPSVDRTESTQADSVKSIDKVIYPYLMGTLGNRIITGYRVIRTDVCTGMQVYIMQGSAYFDIQKYTESTNGSFYEVPVFSDDQWVYLYLKNDGTFTSNKYSPIIGDNKSYIPLAMIWVEAGSTVVESKFIVDLRPNRVANLSEIYGIRSQQAEIFNIVPNTLVGSDEVVLTDASESGTVQIHIQSNLSRLMYMQGHIVILPESTLELTLPESGDPGDYYIIAHGYIDNIDLIYKTIYKQVTVGTTIERYQMVLGKISGLTPLTTEITPGMIDTSYQFYCEEIKSHATKIEDLNSQIPGTDFITEFNFKVNSLIVLINGLKENVTILTDNSFQLSTPVESGDELIVEYDRKEN